MCLVSWHPIVAGPPHWPVLANGIIAVRSCRPIGYQGLPDRYYSSIRTVGGIAAGRTRLCGRSRVACLLVAPAEKGPQVSWWVVSLSKITWLNWNVTISWIFWRPTSNR